MSAVSAKLLPGKKRIRVVAWLNPPRAPPFDRYGIARGPIVCTRDFYIAKCRRVFDWTWPAVYWFLAKQFAGKSTGIECIEEQYVDAGGMAIDVFSADDDEGAGVALSNRKVLFLVSKHTDLIGKEDKIVEPKPGGIVTITLKDGRTVDYIHVSQLKSKTPEQVRESFSKLEPYQYVTTVPSFFYNANDYFESLSSLIDLLKQRGKTRWSWREAGGKERRKIIVVGIREAKILLASRYYAGKTHSRQDAEMDLIDLVDKAFHTGVALAFDSLRYMSITPEIRDITHYTFIKKLGKMKIPPEFKYPMRYANDRYLRTMPKSHAVLWKDDDDIFAIRNDKIEWHVTRGLPILDELGIRVQYHPIKEKRSGLTAAASAPGVASEDIQAATTAAPVTEAEEDDEDEDAAPEPRSGVQSKKWKVSQEIHRRVVKLREVDGLSFEKIKEKLAAGDDITPSDPIELARSWVWQEYKAHREKLCLCPEVQEEEDDS